MCVTVLVVWLPKRSHLSDYSLQSAYEGFEMSHGSDSYSAFIVRGNFAGQPGIYSVNFTHKFYYVMVALCKSMPSLHFDCVFYRIFHLAKIIINLILIQRSLPKIL